MRQVSLLAVFGLASKAFSLGELGNGELVVKTQTTVEYDSNIQTSSADDDDFITTGRIGLGFLQDDKSLVNLDANVAVEFVRFSDFSEFDSENVSSDFAFSYPNNVESRSFYELGGGWSSRSEARREVGLRLDSEQLDFNGSYRIYISEKSGLRFRSSFGEESFDDAAFSDSQDVSAAGDFLYRYSSKLNLVLGYRYHSLEYNRNFAAEQLGHAFAIGADGKLTPKVEGHISFGAQVLDSNSPLIAFEGTEPFYDLELEWQASEKTTVTLSGGADFENSPTGEINNRRDLGLELTSLLSYNMTGSVGLTFAQNDYAGALARKEDETRLDVQYQRFFGENSILSLTAQFETTDSDVVTFDHDRLRLLINYNFIF